jgi:hypothetical protein
VVPRTDDRSDAVARLQEERVEFTFVVHPNALALINGERAEAGSLCNGDLIDLGSAQLRFWLASSTQKTLRVREMSTWVALLALFVLQIGLIYWLLL